jgi:hypothetical protein
LWKYPRTSITASEVKKENISKKKKTKKLSHKYCVVSCCGNTPRTSITASVVKKENISKKKPKNYGINIVLFPFVEIPLVPPLLLLRYMCVP